MGCRGTIEVWENGAAPKSAEAPVVLYTHYGAHDMLEDLRHVLKRKQRWDDPSYLCRMIFSEMIKDDIEGETGYGITTSNVGDALIEIVVDINRKEVIYKLPHDTSRTKKFTFEELINSEEI